jgi:hypothetical protein
MPRNPRAQRSREEKIAIVLEGLKSGNIDEACRKHDLAPALYHRWKYAMEKGGLAALGGRAKPARGPTKSNSGASSSWSVRWVLPVADRDPDADVEFLLAALNESAERFRGADERERRQFIDQLSNMIRMSEPEKIYGDDPNAALKLLAETHLRDAVIVGATVTARNNDTGEVRSTTTGANGSIASTRSSLAATP